MKTVVGFMPPQRFTLEESESHYVGTHVPLAARAFGANPGCLAYHTLRALRQLAPTGRFDHRLTAYRFTEIWYTDDHPATPSPETVAIFDADVPFCIRDMRRYIVTEEPRLERAPAGGTPAHYLLEADLVGGGGRAAVESIVDDLLASSRAGDIRRLWVNWVDRENVIEEGPEPGQRHTPAMHESTTKVAFVFLVLDNARVGEAFFGQPGLAERLLTDEDIEVRVLELSRTVELDKSDGRSA